MAMIMEITMEMIILIQLQNAVMTLMYANKIETISPVVVLCVLQLVMVLVLVDSIQTLLYVAKMTHLHVQDSIRIKVDAVLEYVNWQAVCIVRLGNELWVINRK